MKTSLFPIPRFKNLASIPLLACCLGLLVPGTAARAQLLPAPAPAVTIAFVGIEELRAAIAAEAPAGTAGLDEIMINLEAGIVLDLQKRRQPEVWYGGKIILPFPESDPSSPRIKSVELAAWAYAAKRAKGETEEARKTQGYIRFALTKSSPKAPAAAKKGALKGGELGTSKTIFVVWEAEEGADLTMGIEEADVKAVVVGEEEAKKLGLPDGKADSHAMKEAIGKALGKNAGIEGLAAILGNEVIAFGLSCGAILE